MCLHKKKKKKKKKSKFFNVYFFCFYNLINKYKIFYYKLILLFKLNLLFNVKNNSLNSK